MLEKQDPTTWKKVNDILAPLKASDPKNTYTEKDYPFVECSVYADNIKRTGGAFQSGWHFIDAPFLDEGGKITDYNFTADSHNVTEALSAIKMWFTKEDGYKNTFEYQQIMNYMKDGQTEEDGLSAAMRLFIHYAGDIHQPLHATSRVDKEYPKGDRGGNSFHIKGKDGAYNLHSAFDSVMFEFPEDAHLPFSSTDIAKFDSDISRLMKKWPESQLFNLHDSDYEHWAADGFQVSSKFVYKEINHQEGKALPADYIQEGQTYLERAIVTGGYRLSYNLQAIFNASSAEETMFLQWVITNQIDKINTSNLTV